jgi:hypothetical protein
MIEHNWNLVTHVTNSDSLYYSTSWFYQDAHQKRLAELVYESRGGGNVTTVTYSTVNKLVFNKIKTRLAAYHLPYVGQKTDQGVVWSYYRDADFDVKLALSSKPKVAHPIWYTIVVRPRER